MFQFGASVYNLYYIMFVCGYCIYLMYLLFSLLLHWCNVVLMCNVG